MPSLYEFKFKTGDVAIPQGYDVDLNNVNFYNTINLSILLKVHSELQFIFDFVGFGHLEHKGYSEDLGSGIGHM